MLRIEIQTPDALNDAPHAGTELAKVLRSVAARLEEDVYSTPFANNDEWQTETYRYAETVTFEDEDGDLRRVLIGAVYEILSDAQRPAH